MINASTNTLEHELEADFFKRHPIEAAGVLEKMSPSSVASTIVTHTTETLSRIVESLSPATLERVIPDLPQDFVINILNRISPVSAARILRVLEENLRHRLIDGVARTLKADLDLVLNCPPDTAGAIMDPRVIFLRRGQHVGEALSRLREERHHRRYVRWQRILLVADDDGRLDGIVAIQDLALADPDEPIGDYVQSASFVNLTASKEEMVELLSRHMLSSLPVVDDDGHLVGVVRYEQLISVAQESASADLQTMFGASRDEKALSKPSFAVKKRLPWLQINLLTAFLAAAVVGLFEETIAAYTALAILLPVVAGQSGNTGAQALAVVIRGLALREISSAHWQRVVAKETLVGVINGLAVSVTTSLAVFVWSRSLGLTAVIGIAMILSMAIAGMAGAAIPLLLNKLGQDPAQSSSIILTTVTDVAGFFSFLGIASLFITLL